MTKLPRRTKIIATLGPATDRGDMLERIIKAGVDVVRLNFSHGSPEEHQKRAIRVREIAEEQGREVGIIVDLQGPKIRIERFTNDLITLADGDNFILDSAWDPNEGDQERVGITYADLHKDVKEGDRLLLDDGRIVFSVEEIDGTQVKCKVIQGGDLSNRKGINRQGGGLTAPALTDEDKEHIRHAAKMETDYLAISFVRTARDVQMARELLRAAGGHGRIIAKIERAEAVDGKVLDDIISTADSVMIARGDLGVEIGDEALPPAQKNIIHKARSANRVAITATQMMESMINNQIPTRAEVFDVANAVMDGTDAVMLSAETAAGKFPDKAVEAMGRICRRAERQRISLESDHRINTRFNDMEETISMATMYAANHLRVGAIAALTEVGNTPLLMSRISSGIPIYALSRNRDTRRQITLYRGVYPVEFDVSMIDDNVNANIAILEELKRREAVEDGDLVLITKGDLQGVGGGTNGMKIVRVGDYPTQAKTEKDT